MGTRSTRGRLLDQALLLDIIGRRERGCRGGPSLGDKKGLEINRKDFRHRSCYVGEGGMLWLIFYLTVERKGKETGEVLKNARGG